MATNIQTIFKISDSLISLSHNSQFKKEIDVIISFHDYVGSSSKQDKLNPVF